MIFKPGLSTKDIARPHVFTPMANGVHVPHRLYRNVVMAKNFSFLFIALIVALFHTTDIEAAQSFSPSRWESPLRIAFEPITGFGDVFAVSPDGFGASADGTSEGSVPTKGAALSIPSYEPGTFIPDLATVPWPTAVLATGICIVGVASWDWGDSGFRFNSEGFFGYDTGSLGMDKLGHAYSTYLISDYFNHFMKKSGASPSAPYNAAMTAWGIMLGVEILDGFSSDHGFAYEDLIFNSFGSIFSIVRNIIPGFREKIDYRLEYIPSGDKDGFHPFTDYSGQKYVLAFKLSGFDLCQNTPLRFFELQGGYFARGFTEKEEGRGEPLRREPYVAIGINLSELLFSNTRVGKTKIGGYAARFFEYVQIPYTYVASEYD